MTGPRIWQSRVGINVWGLVMKSLLFGDFLLISVPAVTIGIGASTGYVPMANAAEPAVGNPLQTAHWVGPDFDPVERAFVRVIETQTPHWTDYGWKRLGKAMADDIEIVVLDRAYSSPILYTPQK